MKTTPEQDTDAPQTVISVINTQPTQNDMEKPELIIITIPKDAIDHACTYDKFIPIYKDLADKILSSDDNLPTLILREIGKIDMNIESYFTTTYNTYNAKIMQLKAMLFKLDDTLITLYKFLYECLQFIKIHYKDNGFNFKTLNNKPEHFDVYIKFLMSHLFMHKILETFTDVLTGGFYLFGTSFADIFKHKVESQLRINLFAIQINETLKVISKDIFKAIKSELFNKDYIEAEPKDNIKSDYEKVEVFLVDNFEHFEQFFKLALLNDIMFFFNFDEKEQTLNFKPVFYSYIKENNKNEIEEACAGILNIFERVNEEISDEVKYSFNWNDKTDFCFETITNALKDDEKIGLT